MRNRPVGLLFIASLLLTSIPGGAESTVSFSEYGIDLLSARTAAFGGGHAALADGLSCLFTNPAGFRASKPELSLAEITANLTGPVFSMADIMVQAAGGTDTVALLTSESVQSLLKKLYASASLLGPIVFGYVGDGLGFGFFNTSSVTFTSTGTVPRIAASAQEDVVFAGGYAFRIPLPPELLSKFDVGIMLKAFLRGNVTVDKSMLDLISIFSSISPELLLDQPFVLGVGVGADVGLLWNWNDLLSLGVVGRDVYTPILYNDYGTVQSFLDAAVPTTTFGLVPFDLTAGILFTPKLGFLERYLTGIKVALDYEDILDFLTHPATSENPVLHFGIGVELTLLEVLSLRGGFHDGYFSAGFGVDFTVVRLNAAMFGTELSSEPGLRPAYNLMIGLEFRL
jgi:hypothetical protein